MDLLESRDLVGAIACDPSNASGELVRQAHTIEPT
jgi:hypothetical protein